MACQYLWSKSIAQRTVSKKKSSNACMSSALCHSMQCKHTASIRYHASTATVAENEHALSQTSLACHSMSLHVAFGLSGSQPGKADAPAGCCRHVRPAPWQDRTTSACWIISHPPLMTEQLQASISSRGNLLGRLRDSQTLRRMVSYCGLGTLLGPAGACPADACPADVLGSNSIASS